ncbi:MAG: tetratricopeptide repeat protein, partial [Victivallaceae bacterium]|nr:tetratricopeptide repeat protein [Victivallaceae bacterium]
KEAEKYFNEALRYGSDKPSVLYNYACFLQKKGDVKLAVEYLNKCLAEAPWHDKALNTLGVIYIRSKKPKLALKYLRSAHKLQPRKVGYMLNLTVVLLQNGKKSEAVKMLKKALIIAPDNKSAKSLLSKFHK